MPILYSVSILFGYFQCHKGKCVCVIWFVLTLSSSHFLWTCCISQCDRGLSLWSNDWRFHHISLTNVSCPLRQPNHTWVYIWSLIAAALQEVKGDFTHQRAFTGLEDSCCMCGKKKLYKTLFGSVLSFFGSFTSVDVTWVSFSWSWGLQVWNWNIFFGAWVTKKWAYVTSVAHSAWG